jgi:pseudaminic acid biosynthesis-associated methylase
MRNSEKSLEQDIFWKGSFGDDYIDRNSSDRLLPSSIKFFSKALRNAGRVNSALEYGANIGVNLLAQRVLYPNQTQFGVEINQNAAAILKENIGRENVFSGSIHDFQVTTRFDLVFTKGFLIHVTPDVLSDVYKKIYDASLKFILVAEYYNPLPVSIEYRGNKNKLFKRDFAGDLLDQYTDLSLVDYGFFYRRDPVFPQDDLTWFLIKKTNTAP